MGERLPLLAGLRYTRLGFERRENGFDETFERVTPRVGATYELYPSLSLFAGYAEGFRAPTGFFGEAAPVPETSRALEGGLKLADRARGLSGTIAAFRITRENVPTADPARPFNSIRAGEQCSQGVEADGIWEPTPAFSLLASYAYTDAAVTRNNTVPVGDRLTRVPQHSGRVAGRYRFRAGRLDGLELGAGVTAVFERELTLPNSLAVDGRWALDAQVSYRLGPLTAQLSLVNLTDEGGFDPYLYLNQAVAIPVQPRSVYLTLTTRFGDAR